MNNLKIFESNEFGKIRTTVIDNEPYFSLNDVCRILDIKNPRDVKKRLNKDGVVTIDGVDSIGRKADVTMINEPNLYKLVFQSRKPEAEKFADWVTSEVLPSIRKHGAYMTNNTLEKALLNPDYLIELANVIKDEREKNLQLQKHNSILSVENEIMKPKADYFDELVSRKLNTNFRDTAKMFGIKESIFINWLIENKYIYRDKKRKLMPYSEKNTGLFEVKETMNNKTNWTGVQTLITPLGREEFRLLTEHLKEEEKNKKNKRSK